jgi:hypothetical protein
MAQNSDQPRRADHGVTDGTRTQFASRNRSDAETPLADAVHDVETADAQLAGMTDFDVRQLARTSDDPETLHLVAWSSVRSADAIAISRPRISDVTLISIATHGTLRKRLLVADLDPARSGIARLLADDEHASVRAAVAANWSVPADVLTYLAEDPNTLVAAAAAGNPRTPVDALLDLAKEDDGLICRAVAANPSTPLEVLETLSHSRYSEVVAAVAGNPMLPPTLQREIAYLGDPQALIALAHRPNLHHAAYEDLLHGMSDESVRAAVDQMPRVWDHPRRGRS